MATYDLTKKTNASTGTQVMPSNQEIRVRNLEQKISEQSDKLDRLLNLLQNKGGQV